MKCRIVLYTEGKSELVFVYHLLFNIFDPDKLAIKTIELFSDANFQMTNPADHTGSIPDFEFTLINVGGGERVMSLIKQNAITMINGGHDYICGLKDMYCQQYDQLSNGKLNKNLTDKFIQNHQSELNALNNTSKIIIFFAVMELEAWYFGFIKILSKIGLSETKINLVLQSKYKKNIAEIDPELLFYKPKTLLKEIYKQANNKNYDEVGFAYQIGKNIDLSDLSNLYTTNKLSHFRKFYDFLKSL